MAGIQGECSGYRRIGSCALQRTTTAPSKPAWKNPCTKCFLKSLEAGSDVPVSSCWMQRVKWFGGGGETCAHLERSTAEAAALEEYEASASEALDNDFLLF